MHWRTTVAPARWAERPGLYVYEKLTGVLLRCPKCGQEAGVLYRKLMRLTHRFAYQLRCRSCRDFTIINQKPVLVSLVRDALPAAEVEDLLPTRRAS